MESLGAFPDGEWESFSKMFSTEELDFTSQFHGQCSFLMEHDDEGLNNSRTFPASTFCPTPPEANYMSTNDSLLYSLDNHLNSNLHYISQESSYSSNCSSGIFIATPGHENHHYSTDANGHIPVTNDICMMDEKNIGSFNYPAFPDFIMGETGCINEEMDQKGLGKFDDVPGKELQLKRKLDVPEFHTKAEDKSKKKPRVSRDVNKSKKNAQSKKNQKLSQEEESNAGADGQSSTSYSSEDDNANSQETNNGGETSDSKASGALNSNGKMRASRGSATDPQSLYARKRRERINERLRILQGLVPNGTKVDISTMLEEAVHYVKFLQVQIKLLSSDEMWMYAPIAYNGMDIGLINHKISPPL